jgi:hypothetical protein
MPSILMTNFLVEQSVSNRVTGYDHIQRPGERLLVNLGASPVRGVFRQAGTFGGDFIATQGTTQYRVDADGVATALGTVTGSDRSITAATATRAITAANNIAYSTNGTTVTAVVMPDGRPVSSVAQLNGYFIFTESESARFYWTEPGETNPDGLSFATTESSPGFNVKVERVGDELWFLKEEGVEVWVPTGDADLPFQRVPGRNYDKGARSKDAVCRFDNSVAWVGNDGILYRGDSAPVRISDHALEEQIRKATPDSLRMWSFAIDGHSLLCLTLDSGTYAYDASSQQISEFASYGRVGWRCHVGDAGETFTVGGSDTDGRLYVLDPEVSNDDGDVLYRALTGGIPVVGNPVRCDCLDLYATTGTAEDPNVYAKARISWSDDFETYGDFEDISIGRQGRYGEPIRINRLGAMRYPGRLFKFECTDDVVLTVSGAAYNERSR